MSSVVRPKKIIDPEIAEDSIVALKTSNTSKNSVLIRDSDPNNRSKLADSGEVEKEELTYSRLSLPRAYLEANESGDYNNILSDETNFSRDNYDN
jgi:hypothetical protein